MTANEVRRLRWSGALLAALCCAAPLHADGKYFGKSSATFTNDPAMPSQAAVIAHHDGVETLIIESGVESTGEAVAWLIPVPSAPTSIEAASRGTVMSALDLVGPKAYPREQTLRTIRHMTLPLVLALCVGLLVRTAIVKQAKWIVMVASVVALFGMCFLVPSLGIAGFSASSSGVQVLRSTAAGTYDVHVIEAVDAQSCAAWLTERGFAFDPAVLPVIQLAIDRNWVFCAAEVSLERGLTAPHPLVLTFPSDTIIYPMALTATTIAQQGKPLTLDLVVFADQPVEHRWMTTWAIQPTWSPALAGRTPLLWSMSYEHLPVRHPVLAPLAENSRFATRLHGTVDGVTQRGDMTLVRTQRDPFAVTLANPGDLGLALLKTILACLIPMAILVLPFVGNTLKTRAGRWVATIFAIPIIGLGAWSLIGEVRGLEIVSMGRSVGPHVHQLRRASYAVAADIAEGASSDSIRTELREDLAWVAEDGSLDHSREGLDVPYGWSVTEDAQGRPVVTLYDLTAMPVVIRFGPDGTVITE